MSLNPNNDDNEQSHPGGHPHATIIEDVPSSLEYKDQGFTLQQLQQRASITSAVQDDVPSSINYKDQVFTLQELRDRESRRLRNSNNVKNPSSLRTPDVAPDPPTAGRARFSNFESSSTAYTTESSSAVAAPLPSVEASSSLLYVPIAHAIPVEEEEEPPTNPAPLSSHGTRRSPVLGSDRPGGAENNDTDPEATTSSPPKFTPWYCKNWVKGGGAIVLIAILVMVVVVAVTSGGGNSPDSNESPSLGTDVPPASPATTTLSPTKSPTRSPTEVPTEAPSDLGLWRQLGPDIDGEAAFDEFGWSVALSADGRIMAAGAVYNSGNGDESGSVRVFAYNETAQNWDQLGQDIDGESSRDWSGGGLALSHDGRTVAVGADGNDGNGSRAGHVRVFTFDDVNQRWIQLGSDLDGENEDDEAGEQVALSANGRIVAMSATLHDSNATDTGRLRVFAYSKDLNDWRQLGQSLDGQAYEDYFSYRVAMSDDGLTVAASAVWSFHGAGTVQVFTYSETTGLWTQLGQVLYGEDESDWSGESLALSSDGRTVAIGADGNDGNGDRAGHVRVYFYNIRRQAWQQLGRDIDGLARDDQTGEAVALSSDGRTVAVSGSRHDANGVDSGRLRVFTYNEELEDWQQLGQSIDGEAEADYFTLSVAISADGTTVCAGAPLNDGNGDRSGHVRVFTIPQSDGFSN